MENIEVRGQPNFFGLVPFLFLSLCIWAQGFIWGLLG